MNYIDKIFEAKQNLHKLQDDFLKFKEVLQKLELGDTVYESGVYGDYHPQIVLKVDLEQGRLFTHEKSINRKGWKTSFYLFDEKKKSLYITINNKNNIMILITWFKKIFGAKPAPVVEKKKEFTDKQLAFLKIQYKKLIEHASKLSAKKSKEQLKNIEEKNSKCPKCKSKNVNDRIKRFEGKIDGKSSGYSSAFGGNYSSGSIHGTFDTNEVNKCNDCENEWKKEKITNCFYSGEIIENQLRIIGQFSRKLKNSRNATWDKNDLKEQYNSLEEKRAAMLKDVAECDWACSIKLFWSDYPIELIDEMAEERLLDYDKRHWSESYDYSAMREILKLRTIDEFSF